MPSDFDSIGFNIQSQEEFTILAKKLASEWPATLTPIGGAYVCAGQSDGAQLWIQCSPTNEVIGCHPHFVGHSRFRVAFESLVPPERGTPLDGAIRCTLLDDQEGVPIVVDVPDFQLNAAILQPGSESVLQLCAFPNHVTLSATEEAHRASHLGKLAASGCLIPSGLFRPDGARVAQPTSDAILVGRVESRSQSVNSISGRTFACLTLRTLGGVVDVPCALDDPAAVAEVGWILAGSFSLSGRVLQSPVLVNGPSARAAVTQPAPAKKASLFKRLFGG